LPFGRQSHRRGFHGSRIILPKATRQFDPGQNCPPGHTAPALIAGG
jgi:hypothetical protein